MGFGSAYVNARDLRKRQEAERERIQVQREQIAAAERRAAMADALARDRMAQQADQFATTTAMDERRMDTQEDQFATKTEMEGRRLDLQADQFATKTGLDERRLGLDERRVGVAEGRLEIDQAEAERQNKRNAIIDGMEDLVMQNLLDTQPATTSGGSAGKPISMTDGKKQSDAILEMAMQGYAAIGETQRAEAIANIMDRKEGKDFQARTQDFMQALQYLNNGDTDRAAKAFTSIINKTGLYNEEFSIDPESFSGPSGEEEGAFSFDIVNDTTGERFTSEYQNEQEMISFLLGNSNPVKALEYIIDNSNAYADVVAGAAQAEQENLIRIRENAIDYATTEIERRTDPFQGGAEMTQEEQDALFNELVSEYERRILSISTQPQQGMGSSAMQ